MQYDEDDYQFTHHHKAQLLGPIQIDELAYCERIGSNHWQPEHEYIDYDYRSPEEKRLADILKRLEKSRAALTNCENTLYKIRGTFDTVSKHMLQNQISKLTREIELAESIIDHAE